MHKNPEVRRSLLPHATVAVAAATMVALTVKKADNPTSRQVHFAPETRNLEDMADYLPLERHTEEKHRRLQPHHSQTHPTPAHITYGVTQSEFTAWSKVTVCEESGDWHVRGSEYSGGLGISNENWTHYRPADFPESAADATPYQQIAVAKRIQPNPPDQNGCDEGGW